MFNLFQKNRKCPICKMDSGKNAIAKYGEKFCSAGCVEKYAKKNQISNKKMGGSCCH